MAPADTLFHRDDVDTTQDNTDVQLLPSNAFDQQIWAIDIALADKIKDSSSSNLLVLQVVHQMEKSYPSSTSQRLRIGLLMTDNSTTRLIFMFPNQSTMI